MKTFLKNNWENGVLMGLFLWLCVWATYNTDIFRVFAPGFPHSIFDLAHGVRAFFPFLALFIAIFLLIKNKNLNLNLFKGPLGMLLAFSLIGLAVSFFSIMPGSAIYWGLLYMTAILVIYAIAQNKNTLKKVMQLNWVISGLITIALITIFFSQVGAFSSDTLKAFLSGQRPFEQMNGGIKAEANFFDMAGTRPTGLGRYAGLAALITFAGIWSSKRKIKITSATFFAIFFLILIFSRARTSVIAFAVAILLLLIVQSKHKIASIFIIVSVMLLLLPMNFYQYSYAYLTSENLLEWKTKIAFETPNLTPTPAPAPAPALTPAPAPKPAPATTLSPAINFQKVATLSGRTEGIWKDAEGLFLSSPIWGKGFHADRIYLNGQHAHNSIWQALVQAGILGTIFFVLTFIFSAALLLLAIKKNRKDVVLLQCTGVLVYFIVRGLTESSAYFGADFLFLLPVFAYLQFLPKEKQINFHMNFCGLKIDTLKMPEVLEKINYWIKNEFQKGHWIIVTGMHGTVEACKHTDFKYIVDQADMWVPDGISLVWVARLKGFDIRERISGADLMLEVFKKDYRNFLYGDTEETLLAVKNKFSNSKIETFSPPFRELTKEEDDEIIKKINEAKPDILWVALGLPKQEKWIFSHRDKLRVPVVVGVGAAFKFLSGKVKRAPKWIGSLGFEWLWRLFAEPKVVWKRVFIDMPYFFWLVVKDLFSW